MSSDSDIESKVLARLKELDVEFEWLDCKPELADTALFCEHYKVPLENSGNAILCATKKDPRKFALCVVTAVTRLDVNKTVKKLLGKKCSFASADDTKELTGMMIGGVTPIAVPETLPIYVDASIASLEYVILGGGSRSKKLKISPEVFNKMTQAQFIEGLGKVVS